MIKFLNKEDISATPFVVSKKWSSPGLGSNFLLTDTNYTTQSVGDNFPLGINYTDFSDGLTVPCFSSSSFNYYDKLFSETSGSLRNYPCPMDFYSTINVSPVLNEEFNLLLEEDDGKFIKVETGIKVEKYVRFNPISESRNSSGTYKRLIYDQIKNSYYNDVKDPTKILGLENIDTFLDGGNRPIGSQIKVATIPQSYYGDSIQKGTLRIHDQSQEQSMTLVDDGNGNVVTSGSVFEDIVKDALRTSSLMPNFGYSVSTSDVYSVITSPSFNSNFTKTGSVDVYKYERLTSDFREFDRTISLITESLSCFGNITSISKSDFGRSVDCHNNLVAISCTELMGNNLGPYTSSGFVSIFNLDTTSSIPVQLVSHSLNLYEQSSSFGRSVSINGNYLAVGSPLSMDGGKRGTVYLFKSGSEGYKYETFLTGSSSNDVYFGSCLEIDDVYNKIVVGNGSLNNTSSKVYLFESSSIGWKETQNFSPTKNLENMLFVPAPPYVNTNNTMDGFGNSVSIYCSSSSDVKIAVGAPYDRNIKEYSGSKCVRNGAVYVFEKRYCYLNGVTGSRWEENRLFGDYDNFHSNRFGHSVSIYSNTLAISSPKYISEYTSSYIKETLEISPIDQELKDCDFTGLLYIYTSSAINNWDVYAKYKPKKSNNNPYRFFAHDVEIYNNTLITGDPLPLLDNSIDSIDYTYSNLNTSSSFNGGFHIFNLNDLNVNHHVGNVFYRTGTIVFTSESPTFSTIFENGFNDIPIYDIEYGSLEKLYEKEIICTANPGEFNYSTNPTSCLPKSTALDLNNNGEFDFKDCDLILRSIYKKNNGVESWWDLFNFSNPNTNLEEIESSRFYYHLSSSFNDSETVSLIPNIVSEDSFVNTIETLLSQLDLNFDGKTDELDIKILWRYFIGTLTPDELSKNVTTKTYSTNQKRSFDETVSYINELTKKNSNRLIKPDFLFDRSIDSFTTGSTLTPYVTTIGLYNGLDLVAVAKLGTPIKNQGYFPLNFIVRFDI